MGRVCRCNSATFDHTLRQYPNMSLCKPLRAKLHQENLQQVHTELKREEGGLMHLDVSQNHVRGLLICWKQLLHCTSSD